MGRARNVYVSDGYLVYEPSGWSQAENWGKRFQSSIGNVLKSELHGMFTKKYLQAIRFFFFFFEGICDISIVL